MAHWKATSKGFSTGQLRDPSGFVEVDREMGDGWKWKMGDGWKWKPPPVLLLSPVVKLLVLDWRDVHLVLLVLLAAKCRKIGIEGAVTLPQINVTHARHSQLR